MLTLAESVGKVSRGEQATVTDGIHVEERPFLSDPSDDHAVTSRLSEPSSPGLARVV
jgi:hypothetical protein